MEQVAERAGISESTAGNALTRLSEGPAAPFEKETRYGLVQVVDKETGEVAYSLKINGLPPEGFDGSILMMKPRDFLQDDQAPPDA